MRVDNQAAAMSIEANQTKRLTTWTYNPIWPDQTTKQRALAPIASSRQASLDVRIRGDAGGVAC